MRGVVRMKKAVLLWVLVLLCICGKTVEAADSKADAIMSETEKAMKEVKVGGATMTVEGNLFMEIEVDSNTGVTKMAGLMGSTMWIDQRTNIAYLYDEETSEYYFMPMDDSDIEDNVEYVEYTAEIDNTLTFTYVGEEIYSVKNENVECYKLLAEDSKDPSMTCYYYIRKDSYRLCGVDATSVLVKTQYYYPDSVTIPQEVKQKAKIAPDAMVTQKGIEYIVRYVKKKPVIYVYDGRKAKGKVKIPETIKICGKQYKVQGISKQAFKNNKKITSVIIGKNVRTIEKQAFYGCKKLKNVTIKSSVLTKIGKKAFYKNAKTLKFKVPKKKASKYESLIRKSKSSSEIKISKY